MELLERYLKGDTSVEIAVVETLRRLGEAYAHRRGIQAFDADVMGVDFSAYILTDGLAGLKAHPGDKKAYLRRAARWFVANQTRSMMKGRVVYLEEPVDQWVEALPEMKDLAKTMTSPGAELTVMERHFWEEMERIIQRMSPLDQRVYHLYFRDGLNCVETAAILGWKPATARKRVERLRARLRQSMEMRDLIGMKNAVSGSRTETVVTHGNRR